MRGALNQRERAMLDLLRRHGMSDLSEANILDVGCGDGRALQRLVDLGALPARLHGIDLIDERIERARALNPGLEFRTGSADELPYGDREFELVTQFTMFTSILDDEMRRAAAAEMLRVLRPGGAIIWYDFHVNSPGNADVRGVDADEIRRLFPHCAIELKRITLAPPIARRVAPRSSLLASVLARLPLLCTHYLGVIRRQQQERQS